MAGLGLGMLALVIGISFWGGFQLPAGDADGSPSIVPDAAGSPDPEAVALPPLSDEDAAATRDFLAGAGEPLVDFHTASAALLEVAFDDPAAAADTCRDLAEGPLTEVASTPAQLLIMAAMVPDGGTLQVLVNDVAAKRDLLAACGVRQQEDAAHFQSEVRFTHTVVARRLEQVETIAGAFLGAGRRGSAALTAAEGTSPHIDEPGDAVDREGAPIGWLATGDSYSSGEGLLDAEGDCQLSIAAYAPLVRDRLLADGWRFDPFEFKACTGYVVGNFYNATALDACGNEHGGNGSLFGRAFGEEAYDNVRLNLITLSLGGNDICFSDVAKDCLGLDFRDPWWDIEVFRRGHCDVTFEEMSGRVEALADPLRFQIDSEPCGRRRNGSLADFYTCLYDRHLAESDGHLVVVGYPRVIAASGQWPEYVGNRCYGIRRNDADMLFGVGIALDGKISDQVEVADVGRGRIHHLSTIERFSGHELCGREEIWINGLGAVAYGCPGVSDIRAADECRPERAFHPNERGHRAQAEMLYDLLERLDLQPGAQSPAPVPTPTGDPAQTKPAAPTDVRLSLDHHDGPCLLPDTGETINEGRCTQAYLTWRDRSDNEAGFAIYRAFLAFDVIVCGPDGCPEDFDPFNACTVYANAVDERELIAEVGANVTEFAGDDVGLHPHTGGGFDVCYWVASFNDAGRSPMIRAERERVSLFDCLNAGGSLEVPPELDLLLHLAWETQEQDQVLEFLSSVTTTVSIDGVAVFAADQYWSPAQPTGDQAFAWRASWNYPAGRLAAGESMTVSYQLTLSEAVSDGVATFPPGPVFQPAIHCTVTATTTGTGNLPPSPADAGVWAVPDPA